MAETLTNVQFGISNIEVLIGDYVTAKGAATLVDFGILDGGFEYDMSEESTDFFSDKHLGAILQEPHKRGRTLKFVITENTTDNILKLIGARDADKTGVAPNVTLEPSADEPARYHQLLLKSRGLGTTKLRTWTFYRARRFGPLKIAGKRDQFTKYESTFVVLEEITGAAPPAFEKYAES